MKREAINVTPGHWAQASHVQDSLGLLFISGQVPQDGDGNVPQDIEAQCRLVWANLKTQLEAAGMSYENLVKLNIILVDRSYVKEMVAVRSEIFGERVQPAVTTIIAGLFDARWLIEIEAVAAA